MKERKNLNDLEIFIDPSPLTSEEKIALSKFIHEHKEKNKLKSNNKLRLKFNKI
jgi:hypothetical protein